MGLFPISLPSMDYNKNQSVSCRKKKAFNCTYKFCSDFDSYCLTITFCYLWSSDVLGSEHEEAIRAALEALKSLIHECIDENLIKQGVDDIISSNTDMRKSGPTIIEKICATIESLITYHYAAVWDMSFQVVVAMFDKLGGCTAYYLL